MSSLADFHFLHPLWLLALPAIALLSAWLGWHRASDGAWSRIVDAHLLPLLRIEQGGRSSSPWLLLGLLWTLSVLALAGPAWRRERTAAFRVPAAWMLVLDLSPTMDAADLKPNRVTRARYAIDDILSAARDARVGLVVFAHEPHTVAPLTTDVATIRLLLQPLAPELMPQAGDALAPALKTAGHLLQAGLGERRHVIVLSDGFDDPAQAMLTARRLRKHGTTVDVVGIGTTRGAPEPDGQGGFVHDTKGRTVLTRMQRDRLQRVAAAGGGRFVTLSGLPQLIAQLEAQSSHALARGTAVAGVQVAKWRNGGVWLLPPVLLLAALLARRGWL